MGIKNDLHTKNNILCKKKTPWTVKELWKKGRESGNSGVGMEWMRCGKLTSNTLQWLTLKSYIVYNMYWMQGGGYLVYCVCLVLSVVRWERTQVCKKINI